MQKDLILQRARHQFETANLKKRRLKKCLKPLIKMGDPEAILLFNMLSRYKDDKKQQEYSLQIAKQVASTGFPPAISNLAEIYYNMGNHAKCYPLYQQAAELEEVHALNVLSAVYKFGIDGFEKNLEISKQYEERAKKAKKWDFLAGYNDENIMYE